MNSMSVKQRVSMFPVALAALWICAVPGSALARTIRVRTRDGAAVQRAIDRLPASGGTVLVSGAGGAPITVRQGIVIAKNNVTLQGEDGAVLRLADGANSPVIVVGSDDAVPAQSYGDIRVCNLTIDGNRAAQTSEYDADTPALRNNGISLRRVYGVSVENLTIRSCRSGGLVAELGCSGLTVNSIESYDNHYDGLAAYETTGSTFTGLRLHDNLAAGLSLDIDFEGNIVSNSVLKQNGSVGIFMRDSRDNVFSGLQISGSGEHGIFIAEDEEVPDSAATGNTFQGCMISGSGKSGIRINDASCANNLLSSSQLDNNAEGNISEVEEDLLVRAGLVER